MTSTVRAASPEPAARRRPLHGVAIGILMLDTQFQRFVGDVGNARTWPFPVHYRVVRGATAARVTARDGPGLLDAFKQEADALVADGVDGIATTCGFLAIYQRELARHCSVPVATSALLQVPLAARVLPRGLRPAVMTFAADALTARHLEGAGCDPVTPVFGMDAASAFRRSILDGDPAVPQATLRAEVLDTAARALAADPSIGALVLECTNLTPYSADLSSRFGLPVFDAVTLVHWLHRSLRPERFAEG